MDDETLLTLAFLEQATKPFLLKGGGGEPNFVAVNSRGSNARRRLLDSGEGKNKINKLIIL